MGKHTTLAALRLLLALIPACSASLIRPGFAWSVVNTTANFTASVPVTWSLLTQDNAARVVGNQSGYELLWVTDQFIEIQAGLKGGVFHLRALRNACEGAEAAGCVDTAVWVVFTEWHFFALTLGLFGGAVGVVLFTLSRLRPAAETEAERQRRLLGLGLVDSGVFGGLEGGEETPLLEHRVPRRPPPLRNTAKRVPNTGGGDTL